MSYYYDACALPSLVTSDINHIISGLIKTETKLPMERSKVMPKYPFLQLFMSWENNIHLSLWVLRQKSITLFALSAMLRPSDISPRSVQIVSEKTIPCMFKRSQIKFLENGCLEVHLHGVKNDTDRDGFHIFIQPVSERKVCPVDAMAVYVDKTK